MPNVYRTKEHIKEPGTLKVGPDEATEMAAIIAGNVSVNLPAITALSIASASAAVAGMTSAFNVIVQPQANLHSHVKITAAVGIADGIQVTGANTSASAVDAAATTFSFFAFR